MTERKKPPGSLDPVEMWKQWYETSSREWSRALEGSQETYVDTFGFYQLWLKTLGKAQEQMQAQALETLNPKELWNAWFDATVGAWKKAVEMGGDPLGLTGQWLELMEETRRRIMAGDILPADPFTFFRQWYEATSETWAKVVDDVIGSEKFIEAASPFLEVYANFAKALRSANEEYFSNLQLPTRSDMARVAGLVVTLEEKVDKVEDALENLAEARAGQVESLEGRLGRVENTLTALSASLEKSELAGTVEGLAKRLNEVESKLDKVLTALEKIAAGEQQRPPLEIVKPAAGSRRKSPKKTN
jgi:polyhydroxyalkanoic acid synthase PhaR subunit